MSTSPDRDRARRRGLAGGILGLMAGGLGLAFVVYRLIDGWEEVSATIEEGSLPLLVGALLSGILGMIVIGLNWVHLLSRMGSALPARDGLYRYFIGQLGKYVPGGVWPIVGRAEMASRAGVARATAYSSTFLSLTATYVAAVMLGALLFPWSGRRSPGWASLVLLTIPLGLVALHPRLIGFVLQALRRLTGRRVDLTIPPWSFSVVLVVRHLPAWVAVAAATYLTTVGLGGSEGFAHIGFATCISWFLGFVVVGLPGGLGVREAVFTALAGGLDPAVAAAVALVARMVFILVDLTGAGLSSVLRGSGLQRNMET